MNIIICLQIQLFVTFISDIWNSGYFYKKKEEEEANGQFLHILNCYGKQTMKIG